MEDLGLSTLIFGLCLSELVRLEREQTAKQQDQFQGSERVRKTISQEETPPILADWRGKALGVGFG